MLVLVIGDLHLPHRAVDLPLKFRKLLVPGKIQQIICTGNVCDKETYDYLRTIAADVQVVRGDWDENPHFPTSLVLYHPPLSIGVIHGHQLVPTASLDALNATARAMGVDILLTGHTHRFEAFEYDGRFFVNPGSATGAWKEGWRVVDDEATAAAAAAASSASTSAAAADGEKGASKPATSQAKDGTAAGEASEANGGTGGDAQKPEAEQAEKTAEPSKKEASDGKAAQTEEKKAETGGKPSDAKPDSEPPNSSDAPSKKPTDGAAATNKPTASPHQARGPTPSFALLDVQGAAVTTYVYRLERNDAGFGDGEGSVNGGEVKVERISWDKRTARGSARGAAAPTAGVGATTTGGARPTSVVAAGGGRA